MMTPAEVKDVLWDYVIVGAGMGGATLGFSLSRAGKKILFLEKGEDNASPEALRGDYMELLREKRPGLSTEEAYRQGGRWQVEIIDTAHKDRRTRPMLGLGTGGSSALFGMVMERFFPSDFEPKRYHPEDKESSLPERWPVSYDEMEPYYARAEELYQVNATAKDHFRRHTPRPPAQKKFSYLWLTVLFEKVMRMKGMHPYPLPFACDWKPDCRFCQSILCDKDCKNDASKVALRPALKNGADLLCRAEVVRVNADRHRVSSLTVRWRGEEEFEVRARRYVLAGGALATPILLLDSRSPVWPQGVANSSDKVGRNLMRHLIDLYFLPSTSNLDINWRITSKEIGWNDFYVHEGVKYGTFQAFGKFPPADLVMADMEFEIPQGAPPWVSKFFRRFKAVPRFFLKALFDRSGVGGPILEDLPNENNRVESMTRRSDGTTEVRVHYVISAYDRQRLKRFRKMVKRAIWPPYPYIRFPLAENLKLMAHACGTCRFGDDPRTSVLDRNNRAHDLENLYVVDASFFPSSGGINPSLTIAANALRVADHLVSLDR